jgi:selenocysteine lyase/cysteine desulfurase
MSTVTATPEPEAVSTDYQSLEQYFEPYRRQTVGYNHFFQTPFGRKKIVYADWIASGRLYKPIERTLSDTFGPFVGNTHSESSVTGTTMTRAYHLAHEIIKAHVNAGPDDVILTPGFGMTGAINKFQRILGLRVPDPLTPYVSLDELGTPVVFVTHMEHHSNQTSWLETIAEVVCLDPDENGLVAPSELSRQLEKYKDRTVKIGAFTSCSNVTGVFTPYHELARIMHQHGGYCFVDFAASAPYVHIDMHPGDPMEDLDAIYFSPHKFLGGPGSSGVLVFNSGLYHNQVPDQPGGGTVHWTNPWGGRSYLDDIESREDGGTPGFLEAIRAALAVRLKEQIGVDKMASRERELLETAFDGLEQIPGVHILASRVRDRLGVISFYVDNVHYNLLVKLLNDRYGIQVRGGCSCAGTYGHYLLHVDPTRSRQITESIDRGDLSVKPGWVRLSLHPTMTNEELRLILDAIRDCVDHVEEYRSEYVYDAHTNEFAHRTEVEKGPSVDVSEWFVF